MSRAPHSSQGSREDQAPFSHVPSRFWQDTSVPHHFNSPAVIKDSKVMASASKDQIISDQILGIVYQASEQAQHSCTGLNSGVCVKATTGTKLNPSVDQSFMHASASNQNRFVASHNVLLDTGKQSRSSERLCKKRLTCTDDNSNSPLSRRRKVSLNLWRPGSLTGFRILILLNSSS